MEYLDFLISQIVKEHAGPITDCSADQKSEANGRVQPLDYDFADGRRTILEIGGAEEDRTPDLLRARQALSQLSYGPFSKPLTELTLALLGKSFRSRRVKAKHTISM